MGVDTRRPALPARTESTATATSDLATNLSRRTDKSCYSVPDDGSPVTIPTRCKHRDRDEPSKSSRSQNSQTSLLIEYFEGGKGSGTLSSRPSVRVRVTPSGARRLKDPQQKDTVQISESGGGQKPVFTRRISLTSPSSRQQKQLVESVGDDQSICSSNSADETPHAPVDIEVENRDRTSDLSYVNPASSEVSSMPPDSMLDSPSPPRRKRSQSLDREEDGYQPKDFLTTPSRQRSRSLSKERIAQRVAEKLSNDTRDVSHSKHRRSQRSKGSGKDAFLEDAKPSRRRMHGHRDSDLGSPEQSLLSASAVSSQRDQYSFRSSKSSLNNPKLLETVEDAIRRLILPELKELKKDQKVLSNTSKFDRDMSVAQWSASTATKGDLARRLSKHSSAPDVTMPTVIVSKASRDEGTILAGERPTRSRERRLSREVESPTNKASIVWGSRPELTENDKLRRQKSKGLRDAQAAGRVGTALTAAALWEHESRSSLDSKESVVRRIPAPPSPTDSVNDSEVGVKTELVFERHNVPPMPLRSAVDSEMTRDSLLSQRTAESETSRSPPKDTKTQDVSRGSPIQSTSPSSRTRDRTPLGLRHSNMSSQNLSVHSASDRDLRDNSRLSMSDSTLADGDLSATPLDAHAGLHETEAEYNDISNRRRTLSPIQSVASDRSERTRVDPPLIARNGHVDSEGDDRELEPRLSIGSLSSAPSTDLARSTRHGPSLDSRSEILKQNDESELALGYERSPRRGESWEQDSEAGEEEDDDEDDEEEEEKDYGRSKEDINGSDVKRMTDYTDSEVHYMEKINQGQQVADVAGANPKYVHPTVVESAVASLLDPSVVTSQAATRSQLDSGDQQSKPVEGATKGPQGARQGSPLKQVQDAESPDVNSFPKRMGVTSPPQSVAQSIEEQEAPPLPVPTDTNDESASPNVNHSPESESEINTNPSIIQGPIGGGARGGQDHWPYNPTPPKADQAPFSGDTAAADEHANYAQDYLAQGPRAASYDSNGFLVHPPDDYMGGQLFATPPGQKDEGYVSAANRLSPSVGSPKPEDKGLGGVETNHLGLFDGPAGDVTTHHRNLSGFSHGIPSPMYDSATGRGIERIQSKDIIALMDHLTVRDAQRNARDTELLVTLVRSAAEMRNSFEEMKKFIAHQDELIIEATDRQHERTQRLIGGPRPLPASGTRTTRQLSADDGEDLPAKRRNVFKRALKGLSLKSSNDLSKIENMLEQLLEEVEALRTVQGEGRSPRSEPQAGSVDQEGYEPEGNAGTSTSSPDNQAGYLPNFSRPAPDTRGNGLRGDSENRVSTVHEAEEDLEFNNNERGGFPSSPNGQANSRHERAESLPVQSSGAVSNETTPKTVEKARKHKSSSSSFFPKISRWSKTTASSMGENIRNTMQPGRKERPYSDISRSGSDLAHGPYRTTDFYDPHGDDRLRSTYTVDGQQQQENRPPSPLVPSQVSETPKYRAHRESLDLQHPQPRQGPSGRYQSQLESQAYDFNTPISPTSDQWGSNPSLLAPANPNQNRYSSGGRLSPISDAGYSEATSRTPPPPRPPKIKDDGPLVPERASQVGGGEEPNYVDRVVSRSSVMRSSPRSTPPLRKPTGPRPLTTSGSQHSPGHSKRTRYRGSPVQTVDDEY